ncbi:MAG: molybdopterin-dependent oxidoreductase [Spirochaetales bacterium]|nr:molybdopterin-dependent oxidoreductase [Spirochaetales bacterium]
MNYDIIEHVKGTSLYVDDLKVPAGTLHAAVITSPSARGKIIASNFTDLEKQNGVIRIITSQDIPGENQIGNIIPDEVLLAVTHVDFIGMPVALVIADTAETAWRAAAEARITIREDEPVTDPRQAYAAGDIIGTERVFSCGNCASAWKQCSHIIGGTVESGGQEHFYLETQAALAVPQETGKLRVFSSTQSPTSVQKVIARVLDWGMHRIEVDVLRLGGAFGGKEDQATPWAVMASLAAVLCGRPVKLVLPRKHDMVMTGKRHPYTSDYKIGFDSDGKILAYEVMFYQNSGAAADLSTAILERTLFHTTGCYYIPNVSARAACCRTNLPPFTAFRGFGGPQAMFVIESALFKASRSIGIEYYELQKRNLLSEGNSFPYGQKAEHCRAGACLDTAEKKYRFASIFDSVGKYNSKNTVHKKGFSVMPVCFGISFTNTMLNQGYSLLHVYQDGTVGISTGAVEMGQGVNRKIQLIAAAVFNIDPGLVRIESTNTSRVANTSATAASCGTDLNGKATEQAAEAVKGHLRAYCARGGMADPFTGNGKLINELVWKEIVGGAYAARVTLSAHSHYATPEIYFDPVTEKGHPFAYHAYGIAGIETSLNTLNGEYSVDKVMIVHDLGRSIDAAVDVGQVEGGLVQGIGWMTVEEFAFNVQGRILSNNCSNYKVPDISSTPGSIEISFLENAGNEKAVFGSKAVGEPPFMYGIAAYFSLLTACLSRKEKAEFYNSPITPEKIITHMYAEEKMYEQQRPDT